VIGLLKRMVRVDSVNAESSGRPDAERELAELLEAEAQGMGLSTRRLEVPDRGFNLLVEHKAGEGRPWVLLYAHLDTVSAEGMTVPPFEGRVLDGRLYGRGALDDKAGAAAALHALKAYAQGEDRPNNAGVLFVVDEEVTHAGAQAFVSDHLPDLGYRPSGIVLCEPTDLLPFTAHNGLLHLDLVTRGLAAHASEPARGRSAISAMAVLLQAVERDYLPGLSASDPLCGKAVGSVNRIRGGTSANIIPDECVATLDRRIPPGETLEEVFAGLEAFLARVRGDHPDWEIEVGRVKFSPALPHAAGDPFVEGVLGVLGGMGLPSEPRGAPFGTDAGTFAEAGLSCVVLGPGDPSKNHQADEFVEVEKVVRGVEVLAAMLRMKLK
jgi:acetylornithine deacetylase